MANNDTNPNPVNLTDEEMEGIAELEAEESGAGADEEADASGEVSGDPRKDRAWLDPDREELKGFLTEAELAALADEDEGDAAPAGDEAPAEADPAPPAPEAETPAPAAPTAQPAPPAADTQTLSAEDQKAIRDQTMAALDKATADFEDGELTAAELRTKQREILDGEADLIRTRLEENADARAQQEFEARKATFLEEAGRFFRDNPVLGTDAHLESFDGFARLVQSDRRNAALTPRQVLDKAKALYVADAKSRNEYIPGLSEPPPRPKHATRDAPPSLGRVPAAAINEPEGSRLAQIAREIDAADSERAERIMARLTPSEREAILSGEV